MSYGIKTITTDINKHLNYNVGKDVFKFRYNKESGVSTLNDNLNNCVLELKVSKAGNQSYLFIKGIDNDHIKKYIIHDYWTNNNECMNKIKWILLILQIAENIKNDFDVDTEVYYSSEYSSTRIGLKLNKKSLLSFSINSYHKYELFLNFGKRIPFNVKKKTFLSKNMLRIYDSCLKESLEERIAILESTQKFDDSIKKLEKMTKSDNFSRKLFIEANFDLSEK